MLWKDLRLTSATYDVARADKANLRPSFAGSLARAMWLSGVSECERSEARRARGYKARSVGGLVRRFTNRSLLTFARRTPGGRGVGM